MPRFWLDPETGKEMVEIVSDPQTSWRGRVDEMSEEAQRAHRRELQAFRDWQNAPQAEPDAPRTTHRRRR